MWNSVYDRHGHPKEPANVHDISYGNLFCLGFIIYQNSITMTEETHARRCISSINSSPKKSFATVYTNGHLGFRIQYLLCLCSVSSYLGDILRLRFMKTFLLSAKYLDAFLLSCRHPWRSVNFITRQFRDFYVRWYAF